MVTINYRNTTKKSGIVYNNKSSDFENDEMCQELTNNLYLRHIVYYNT